MFCLFKKDDHDHQMCIQNSFVLDMRQTGLLVYTVQMYIQNGLGLRI